MKKNLIYSGMIAAALIVTATVTTNAQNWLTAGNGGSATQALGTTAGTGNNFDLRIKTNNVVRMTVKQSGRIGIGNTAPKSKLDINGGSGTSDTVAVVNAVVKKTGAFEIPAIMGTSQPNPGWGIGVQGNGNDVGVFGNGGNVGIIALSGDFADTTSATGNESDGIDAIAGVANFSIGGYFQAVDGQFNTGIYAVCGPTGTPSDSDNTHHRWAGQFIGDIVYSRAFRFSDGRLKNNVKPLENILSKLSQIQTSSYTFKQSEYPGLCLPGGNQIGFIAENVAKVFPELVKDASMPEIKANRQGRLARAAVSFQAVNYEGFIPLAVAAINEQQKQLDTKDAQIADLNARLSAIETKLSGGSSAKLSSVNNVDASLEQNNPNPFNQSTQIRYSIPADYSSAKLIITSIDGKSVRTYTLSGKGQGQVTLNASELSVGSYTYSLNVDGKILDTKTLVLTK
jgi:hypothetical protein